MDGQVKPRQIVLDCSEWDFDIIQDALACKQKRRDASGKVELCRVDDGSNLAAAIIAEICDAWLYDRLEFEKTIRDESNS